GIEDGNTGIARPLLHQPDTLAPLATMIGRGIERHDELCARFGGGAGWCIAPDILADRHAQAQSLERENTGCIASLEIALLIEHLVVWQTALAIQSAHLACLDKGSGVVERLAIAPGQPDQQCNVRQFATDG